MIYNPQVGPTKVVAAATIKVSAFSYIPYDLACRHIALY